MKPKIIGIDARFYGEAGPGRYVKNIVEHLEKVDSSNKYYIFLREKGFKSYEPENHNFIKVLADVKWYTWYEQFVFLYYVLKYPLDLLYVPHFNIPVLYPFKLVTAIPDIIMHTYSTERGTTLPKPYFRFKKFIYKLVLTWALIRSKYVIVPSNDVKNDMMKYYGFLSDSKFVLAYEGVDPVFTTANDVELDLTQLGINRNFLLYISSMYEHKNVKRLIDAFEQMKTEGTYLGQMVLVGKKDKFSEDVLDYVKSKGLEKDVVLPGNIRYITDHEIVALRKTADLYVFPSLKEGFSLTPLEAQSVGLPCVISDIPCHREVFDDSVVYFNPQSVDDIAQKISETVKYSELKEMLRQKGYAQVKKYNWLKTAEITKEVFDKTLS